MVKKVTLTNSVTKDSIVIDSKDGYYIIDEIDWDTPSVEMSAYRVPYQIGQSYAGLTVGTRKPTITGYVVAKDVEQASTWEQYWENCETAVQDKKEELDRMISIYQEIVIEANGFYLDARPTAPPKYSNTYKENNEVLCKFILEFECFNPMFYKETKTINFSVLENKLKFPLTIPKTKGITMGVERRQKIVLFENNGDVPVGCIIRMKAITDSLITQQVNSITEDAKIIFSDLSMSAGDEIVINTNIGEESVKLHTQNGDEVSIVGNMEVGYKLFKILIGKNYYSYETQPSDGVMDVTVEYREQYFNIRGM